MKDREPRAWITVHGQHIPIFDGESTSDAIKNRLRERAEKESNQKEAQIAKNREEAQRKNSQEVTSHYRQHQIQIAKLNSDKYADGTYNIGDLSTVEFDRGFQFTFCQIGDNYSESEYNNLCNSILSKLDNKTIFAGKFGGSPEISFYTTNRELAVEIARRYNQISVWDWGACDEIKTGGTGRRK